MSTDKEQVTFSQEESQTGEYREAADNILTGGESDR